jgi:hypothetical protein
MGSTLSVAGDATFNSSISVASATTLGSTLSVASDATFGGTVSVANNMSILNDLNVSGNTTLNDLTFTGSLDLTSLTLSGTLSVGGNTILSGTSYFGGVPPFFPPQVPPVCIINQSNVSSGLYGTISGEDVYSQFQFGSRPFVFGEGVSGNGQTLYLGSKGGSNPPDPEYEYAFVRNVGLQINPNPTTQAPPFTVALSVIGDVSATTYTTTSDYRLKTDIEPLNLDTFNIDRLNPVHYHLKKDKDTETRLKFGLIAHELADVYPFLVNGEKDGKTNQTVDYTSLIGLLIKEVQSLKQRIQILESRNSSSLVSTRHINSKKLN